MGIVNEGGSEVHLSSLRFSIARRDTRKLIFSAFPWQTNHNSFHASRPASLGNALSLNDSSLALNNLEFSWCIRYGTRWALTKSLQPSPKSNSPADKDAICSEPLTVYAYKGRNLLDGINQVTTVS